MVIPCESNVQVLLADLRIKQNKNKGLRRKNSAFFFFLQEETVRIHKRQNWLLEIQEWF